MPEESNSGDHLAFAHSTQLDLLATSLSILQKSIRQPHRNRSVRVTTDRGSYDFKYADLSVIMDSIRDLLSEHEMCISHVIHDRSLVTLLMHNSGQWISSSFPIDTSSKNPQAIGSLITYARRYSICAMLGIVADDDDDGNAAVGNHVEDRKAEAMPPDRPETIGVAGAVKIRSKMKELEWNHLDLMNALAVAGARDLIPQKETDYAMFPVGIIPFLKAIFEHQASPPPKPKSRVLALVEEMWPSKMGTAKPARGEPQNPEEMVRAMHSSGIWRTEAEAIMDLKKGSVLFPTGEKLPF